MFRRRDILKTVACSSIAVGSLSLQPLESRAHSVQWSDQSGNSGEPDTHLGDIKDDRVSNTNITNNAASSLTITGELSGNFDPEVGDVYVSGPGEVTEELTADGTFEFVVPDQPENPPSVHLAYLQLDSESGPITFNGVPDTYYLKHLEDIQENKNLGTFEIPTGYTLDITVVDGSGNPLDNVETSIRSLDSDTSNWWGISTTTNENGRYVLGDTPPGIEVNGPVEIAVQPSDDDDRLPDTEAITRLEMTEDREETIVVDPIDVSGQFELPSGEPATDGLAYVITGGGNVALSSPDENGSFSLSLPQPFEGVSDDYYNLRYYGKGVLGSQPASHNGIVDLYADVSIDGAADQEIGTVQLPQGDIVEVTVVDEEEEPVEDARVGFEHENTTFDTVAGLTTGTDAAGQVTIDDKIGVELSGTVNLTIVPPPDADDDRFADRREKQTITVTEPTDITVTLNKKRSVTTYTNNEGVVDTDGLRKAINDWRENRIQTKLLREVTDYWHTEGTVN